MIEISHLLRKAYLDALAGLELEATPIPVFDEYVDPNIGTASLSNCTAHVAIQNQTVNDASLKCGTNQSATLQLDIVTEFPINSGGFLTAELISNEILQILFPDGGKTIALEPVADIKVWRGWLESARNIPMETSTHKIYRRVLILQHSVTQ